MRLTVELVPFKAWEQNVRTRCPAKVWDRIKKIAYRRAGHRCEVCGESGLDQGREWPVEGHEQWEYDDVKHTQKLVGAIALCPLCHEVKHAGRTIQKDGKRGLSLILARLMVVNDWTERQATDHLKEAFAQWEERSKHPWTLDLSWVEPSSGKVPVEEAEVE